MNEHNKAILLLIMTALLWSTGGLLIKLVQWNPIAIAGGRSAIALVFLLIYTKKIKIKLTSVNVAGGLAYTGTVILFVASNKLTTAANAILLQYTAPIYVAIFASWFLNERMTRVDIISIVTVMIGITLFFIDKLSPGNLLGNFTAVISGVAFAWLILLLRKQKDASPIDSIVLGNLFTAIIGIPFMFNSLPSLESCAGLFLLGTFQLGLSYILYTNAIKHVTAIEGVLIPVIEPLLNPLWVLIFLNEKPGFWPIIGGVVVLLSITLRSIFTLKRRYLPV